ncbi:MAG: IS4 family transposase [Thomasclavelia sp.]|uniref:IS4 family transposase n=1 Tax=Thomasclavelia sp. TaxID=3025757 RepID=UPI003992E983
MNNYKHLKNVLNYNIKKIAECSSLFCENSAVDFTRNRKLNFETTIKNVISMETGSLKDELLKLNDYSVDTPTASAFIQARSKIRVEAFQILFDRFNEKTHKDKLFKGYRLLAIDGSVLPIDNTIYDEETTELRHGTTAKAYSAYHLNASYDLLECTYDDLIIQGEAKKNENDAFCQLVDRYKGKKAIFIADRNYESYNGFEHVVQSGNKYLIRVKDIHSKSSITQSLGPFTDDEFDIDVFRMLTLKQNKMTKACPQLYKFIPSNMRFDFMTKENPWYEFHCRVVRFKITDDTYECIITNLDRDEFSIDDIKNLYCKRWGIENSFRELKYAIGLNALHSKKRKLIQQEIYARMTLYNFCQRIVQEIKIPKKDKRKYEYQVNFTRSFHILRHFLNKKGGETPPVDHLIAKEILPIRPGRSNTRNVQSKTVVCFNYRFD